MKKVLVFLADGFEEIEAVTAIDYLRRAGATVVIAATGTQFEAKTVTTPVVTGAHKICFVADQTLTSFVAQMKDSLPDAVVVPGGMPGAANIAACKEATSLISELVRSKKIVAAICAAPAVVLSQTEALAGHTWTCYPGMADRAEPYKRSYKDGPAFVSDGTLITGRGPGAAEQFAMEVVRVLFGESTAVQIKAGACQR